MSWAWAAADRAGTPVVYMATMDRDFMVALRTEALASGQASEEDLEGAEHHGRAAVRITTEVGVTPWLGAKRGAMAAHASQITEDSFFLQMPEDVFANVWGQEWYIRVRPEPVGLGDGVRETGLLVSVDGTLAGGAARQEVGR